MSALHPQPILHTPRPSGPLIGPELFWACVVAVMHALAAGNVPPTEPGSLALEKWWYLLPLVFAPLTFAFFLRSQRRPWWMFLRVNLAASVGGFWATYRITEAIDYQDSRNSGVGMGFVLSLSFGFFVLLVADIASVIIIAVRARRGKPK